MFSSLLAAFRSPPVPAAKPKADGHISPSTAAKFRASLRSHLADGMTQKELSALCDVSQPMVSLYLNGTLPRKSRYLQIRKALQAIPERKSKPQDVQKPARKRMTMYETSDLNVGSYLYLRGAKVDKLLKVSDFPKRVIFTFKHDDLETFLTEFVQRQKVSIVPYALFQSWISLKNMAYSI